MKTTYAGDEALAGWIQGLPMRWALGGFLLGVVWSLFSGLLQGYFSSPVGGYVAAVVRVFALILLPVCALGFLWGWSERVGLRRRLARSRGHPSHAVNGWILRQTAKAMLCGVIFGIFTYAIDLYRFQLWENVAAVSDNITGVLAFAILAAPVGIIVGAVSKQNLRQHLSGYDLQEAAE